MKTKDNFPACTRSSSIHSQVLRDTFGLSPCLLTSAQSKDVELRTVAPACYSTRLSLTPDVYRLQESRFCPSICLARPLEMLALQHCPAAHSHYLDSRHVLYFKTMELIHTAPARAF